jgi:hypothetical protein
MAFDLEAARAKRAEEAQEEFTYSLGGEKFSLPPQTAWPIDVGDLLAQGKVKEAFVLLSNGRFPEGLTLGDVKVIMEAASEFYGMGSLPNS